MEAKNTNSYFKLSDIHILDIIMLNIKAQICTKQNTETKQVSKGNLEATPIILSCSWQKKQRNLE
jgi:hypothetical protein